MLPPASREQGLVRWKKLVEIWNSIATELGQFQVCERAREAGEAMMIRLDENATLLAKLVSHPTKDHDDELHRLIEEIANQQTTLIKNVQNCF